MNRPATQGFQKPLDNGKRRDVSIAIVTMGEGSARCSCGQPFTHRREKVREDQIDRHLLNKHGGQGIRL